LETLMAKMGAKPVKWKSDIAAAPDWEKILGRGQEVNLDTVEIVDQDLFSYKGQQVLLYIRDTRQSREILLYGPEEAIRYHVCDCETLQQMRRKGRSERYVVTNNLSGLFKVDAMKPDTEEREEIESELKVCRNCLKKLDYKGYDDIGSPKRKAIRDAIWRGFSIKEFFDEYRSVFANLPSHTDVTAPTQGYTKDWPEISRRYRQSVNWKCEQCGVDLTNARSLLDTHHKNGQTGDNARGNLKALCKICHSEQSNHGRLHIRQDDRRQITQLRKTEMDYFSCEPL